MKRKGTAESWVLEETHYSFAARFDNGTGTNPEELIAAGFVIPSIHLNMTSDITGAKENVFNEAAAITKENCSVSKLVSANITMEAKLDNNND
jgi:osmotically inducible protein OsmC